MSLEFFKVLLRVSSAWSSLIGDVKGLRALWFANQLSRSAALLKDSLNFRCSVLQAVLLIFYGFSTSLMAVLNILYFIGQKSHKISTALHVEVPLCPSFFLVVVFVLLAVCHERVLVEHRFYLRDLFFESRRDGFYLLLPV